VIKVIAIPTEHQGPSYQA